MSFPNNFDEHSWPFQPMRILKIFMEILHNCNGNSRWFRLSFEWRWFYSIVLYVKTVWKQHREKDLFDYLLPQKILKTSLAVSETSTEIHLDFLCCKLQKISTKSYDISAKFSISSVKIHLLWNFSGKQLKSPPKLSGTSKINLNRMDIRHDSDLIHENPSRTFAERCYFHKTEWSLCFYKYFFGTW